MRVLLVEDDPTTSKSIEMMLGSANLNVYATDMGEEGIDLAKLYDYDLILLDLNLPDMNGHDVLRQLRLSRIETPILILSGSDDTENKIRGFGFGADDYMTKPFSPRELVARVRAVLRRGRDDDAVDDGRLRFDGLVVDVERHEVQVDETSIELTNLEFQLLVALAGSPGRVFTRRQLIEQVWGWDFYGDERLVDVHVRNLRKSLGDPADAPRFIGTVRGVGYKLVADRR